MLTEVEGGGHLRRLLRQVLVECDAIARLLLAAGACNNGETSLINSVSSKHQGEDISGNPHLMHRNEATSRASQLEVKAHTFSSLCFRLESNTEEEDWAWTSTQPQEPAH